MRRVFPVCFPFASFQLHKFIGTELLYWAGPNAIERFRFFGFPLLFFCFEQSCTENCPFQCFTFFEYVAGLNDSRSLKRALVCSAGGGKMRSFDLSDTPVTKLVRGKTLERVAGSRHQYLKFLNTVCFGHRTQHPKHTRMEEQSQKQTFQTKLVARPKCCSKSYGANIFFELWYTFRNCLGIRNACIYRCVGDMFGRLMDRSSSPMSAART